MEVTERRDGEVTVLELVGKLDSNTAKGFEERLMGLIDKGNSRLVLDFGRLDYISSAGLRVLLMAAKRLKAASGRMALCGMSEHIREVFEISGFSSIFAIHGTQQESVAAV